LVIHIFSLTAWADPGVPNLPGTQKEYNKSTGTMDVYAFFVSAEVSANANWAENTTT
jgi:hypothetical protein